MPYDVFCHKLADKIMELQGKERDHLIDAYEQRAIDFHERNLRTGEQFFNQTYL